MNLKRDIDKEDEGKRGFYFLILVALIFSLLVARLFYLQILQGDKYKEMAFRNSLRINVVKSARGKIYDVNGEILADNITGYKIIYRYTKNITSADKEELLKMYINKSESSKDKLNDLFFDINYISQITGESFSSVLDTFYKTVPQGFDREIVVVEDIPVDIALKEVEKLPNDRIDIIEYDKRYYPNGKLASHALGYVKLISASEYEENKDDGYQSDDLIGKQGIEKQYDKILHGQAGQEYVEVDVKGNVKKVLDETRAISGSSIYLSIDKNLQEYMTNSMKGLSGSFIAIDVKTGKILTFVSSPELDSNFLSSRISSKEWEKIVNDKSTPLVNKAIAGLYPPGSIFKIISGASILESGIKATETVNSTGTYTLGKVTFREVHSKAHGITNFYKSIKDSVNTYYYEFIQRVNLDDFFRIAKSFGIGEKTGIDIPGEQEGLLPTPEWKKNRFKNKQDKVWLPGDLINMSIGQGYLLTTPIQMLMAYQAIANDGIMLYPTLVDKFVEPSGNEVLNSTKVKQELDISKETLKTIQEALKLPVQSGTATKLKFDFVSVSAKTGTAQNSSGKDHSWVAGYFPSDNPKIAFISFVQNGGYGGVVASNQAKNFIEKYYEKGENNDEQ